MEGIQMAPNPTKSSTLSEAVELSLQELTRQGYAVQLKKKLQPKPELATKKDDSGRILLHWAASGKQLELSQLLLSTNPDSVDAEDDLGWTPLMIASSVGAVEVVRYLISKGADVNQRNCNGQSPLHYAASKQHMEILRVLLDNGAEVNAQDKYGHTPLHRAAAQGHINVVSLLLRDPHIAVNVTDRQGDAALHCACEERRNEVAMTLVKAGAHLDKRNRVGKTPLDMCEPKLRNVLLRMAESG